MRIEFRYVDFIHVDFIVRTVPKGGTLGNGKISQHHLLYKPGEEDKTCVFSIYIALKLVAAILPILTNMMTYCCLLVLLLTVDSCKL